MTEIKMNSFAVSLLFIFNGCLFGTWAAKVPFFKEIFELDEKTLSILLLVLAFGAVTSFPLAGRLNDKLGVQKSSKISYLLYPIPFIGLALSSNFLLLTISLFFFGFLHGSMDVAMNSWAAKTETLTKKKLMSFFHAMFSLGAGVGAGSTVFFIWADISTVMHFLIVSLLFIPLYLILCKPSAFPLPQNESANGTDNSKLPFMLLSAVGLMAFCSALGEGAIADWGSVIMRQEFSADMSFSAWAYATFSMLMVLSRLSVHFFIEEYGVINIVKGCSLFSLFGAVIIVLVSSPYLALIGFAFMGIGYSVIVPLVFSKAASINQQKSGRVIAFVATFAYGGMLCGPVVIGLIAHQTTLKSALLLLVALPIYTLLTASLLKSNKEFKLKNELKVG
ncbi:MFS transporter [Colwellia psychrerythraea]|uniref:Major facilitator superfamily MFS_1 n=1 Tax=Colwellia psychrerythraea TaxID=28229 RepID=A0A099KTF5_COLPS|nr:MFS transporter [Colwellia psychrerythraea]KGJ92958.1 major facilitator superfamily MFS_1 [Colwellia psychrerythraea]